MILLADTETNGLLEPKPGEAQMDKIHCLCLMEPGAARVMRFHDQPDLCERDGSIHDGLALVEAADERWFHNGIGFDDRAIKHVYPDYAPRGVMRDSLVIARTIWPDEHLKHLDFLAVKKRREFPKELIGRHRLEAWGYRLRNRKGEQPESWAELTPAMLEYCAQDVAVLDLLRRRILDHQPTLAQIELEQAFAPIVRAQELRGFRLDTARVSALVRDLSGRRAELDLAIRAAFPDFIDHYVTPVRQEHKSRTVPFNPQSGAHVARALTEKYGWQPAEFTPDGRPKMDEAVVASLPYPEAKNLAERAKVAKTLGTIAEGTSAWLKLVTPAGRVHGRMNHNAAVTSRCTHSKPNLGNVDKSPPMRRCWIASPGNKLVIGDAKGIQARILAHYAYPFDGGEFARLVLEGDIHDANRLAAEAVLGRPATRDQAKIAFYAMLFGAQGLKVGSSFGTSAAVGTRIREAILSRLPGLARVIAGVEADAAARGWIKALDGRRLWVRCTTDRRGRKVARTALVTLAQGGEAICMKQAIVDAQPWTAQYQVMEVHDEVVLDVPASLAEDCAVALKAAIVGAGVKYKLRVPLDAKVVIGQDWSAK